MDRYNLLKEQEESDLDNPLLSDDGTQGLLISSNVDHGWRKAHIFALYILVLMLSITATTQFLRRPKDIALGELFTPAASVVEYEQREFTWNFWDKGPYMGIPNDEKDQLWSDLYNFGTSGIPNNQATRMLYDTVSVPGSDSQSLIMLDMWHQLHCLNAVRRALYPARWPDIWTYKEDGSVNYDTVEMKHIDHCIDHIRQSLQCFADVSPTGFFFDPEKGNNPRTEGTHMCKKFDPIKNWALERQVHFFSLHEGAMEADENGHGHTGHHHHEG